MSQGLHMIGSFLFYMFIFTSCGGGSLEDGRNRYLSIYGVDFVPPSIYGGFLGRVVDGSGYPARGARVYLDGMLVGTTNGKGGFYLSTLTPATHFVIVTSTEGPAKFLEITAKNSQLVENERIILDELVQVSGKITLSDELIAEGTIVSLAFTPFRTTTDVDGTFNLLAPPGRYKLRAIARSVAYMPEEIAELEIQSRGRYDLNLTLQEYPYPNGQIKVRSDDGFLVRGHEVVLDIETLPGVRYMRIEPTLGVVEDSAAALFRKWIPVQKQITLKHTQDGYFGLIFTFQDLSAKQSIPIEVNYLAVDLDTSWRILYGRHFEPVTIKKGEKVALVESSLFSKVDGAVADKPISAEVPEQEAGTTSGSASGTDQSNDIPNPSNSSTGAYKLRLVSSSYKSFDEHDYARSATQAVDSQLSNFGTAFYDLFTVEEGVTIRGSGSFNGNLEVNGTKENPVVWDLNDGWLVFNNSQSKIKYAEFQNGNLERNILNMMNSLVFEDTSFKDVYLQLDSGQNRTDVKFIHSRLESSIVRTACLSMTSNTKVDESIHENKMTFGFSIEMANNLFSASSLDYQHCGAYTETSPLVSLAIDNSNLLGAPEAGYFFGEELISAITHQMQSQTSGSQPAPTPTPQTDRETQKEISFRAVGNYYESQAKVFKGIDPSKWPSFLGAPLNGQRNDVGPR